MRGPDGMIEFVECFPYLNFTLEFEVKYNLSLVVLSFDFQLQGYGLNAES